MRQKACGARRIDLIGAGTTGPVAILPRTARGWLREQPIPQDGGRFRREWRSGLDSQGCSTQAAEAIDRDLSIRGSRMAPGTAAVDHLAAPPRP